MNTNMNMNKIKSANTKNYTVSDIEKELDECKELLYNIGYKNIKEKTINVRVTKLDPSIMGQTKILYNTNQEYIITINQHILNGATAHCVHEVIMHELCHCLFGCEDHSSSKRAGWNKAANLVHKNYPELYDVMTDRIMDDSYREYYNSL